MQSVGRELRLMWKHIEFCPRCRSSNMFTSTTCWDLEFKKSRFITQKNRKWLTKTTCHFCTCLTSFEGKKRGSCAKGHSICAGAGCIHIMHDVWGWEGTLLWGGQQGIDEIVWLLLRSNISLLKSTKKDHLCFLQTFCCQEGRWNTESTRDGWTPEPTAATPDGVRPKGATSSKQLPLKASHHVSLAQHCMCNQCVETQESNGVVTLESSLHL